MIKPGIPHIENDKGRLVGFNRRRGDGMIGTTDEVIMIVAVKSARLYQQAFWKYQNGDMIRFGGRKWHMRPLGTPLVYFRSFLPSVELED